MKSFSPRRLNVGYLRGLSPAFYLPPAGGGTQVAASKPQQTQVADDAHAAARTPAVPAGAQPAAVAPTQQEPDQGGDFVWSELATGAMLEKLRESHPLLEVDVSCALLENSEQGTPPESAAHFSACFASCLRAMAVAGCFAPGAELSQNRPTRLYLHPPVYTCEQATKYCASEKLKASPHLEMKNLFLKDKKKNLFLASALVDTAVPLKSLKLKGAASGGLSFASNELLLEVLGLLPGSVTPFGLLNDREQKRVTYYLDAKALRNEGCEFLGFHPNACNATVGVHRDVFREFIEKVTCHEVHLLE